MRRAPATASLPLPQPIPQPVLQAPRVVDFPHRRVDVVLDATEADGVAVEQDVAGPPVAVARLAHRPDVDGGLAVAEPDNVATLLGAGEVPDAGGPLGEDAGDVRVPLEAAALDQGEDALHLARVVDVLGEDVLVE